MYGKMKIELKYFLNFRFVLVTKNAKVHIVDQRVTGRLSGEMGVNGSRMDRDRIFYDGDDRRNSGERQYDAEQEKEDVLRF